MSEFVHLVRSGSVRQPTQRNFSPATWERAFSRLPDPTEADTRLYRSGLWFFNYLERVRLRLGEFDNWYVSPQQTVRLHTAVVNFTVGYMSRDYHERVQALLHAPQNNDGSNESTSGVTPAFALAGDVEGFVDAARYAIAEALNEQKAGNVKKNADDLVALKKVQVRLQTAGLYDALESLWAECLWNDWYVSEHTEGDLVIPSESKRQEIRAIGDYRSGKLSIEFTDHSFKLWPRLPPSVRKALVSSPRIRTIIRKGKKKKLMAGPGEANAPFPPTELTIELAAKELYLYPFLDESLPLLSGLTLNQLIEGWNFLAPLGSLAQAGFPAPAVINRVQHAMEFAPSYDVRDLELALSQHLKLSSEQAEKMLSLFTFASVRDDVWQRPFVRADENRTTFVACSLQSPNLLRSLEQWMKIGGFDLDRRGPVFEDFVRSELSSVARFASYAVHPTSLDLAIGEEQEQIDLVIRLGNTIIIGEVKCSVSPSGPREFHNYYGTLEAAASQAARKAQFAAEHFKMLSAMTGFSNLGECPVFVPAVVTNLPFGAGLNFGGVPVTDLLILTRYFDEGTLGLMGYLDSDGKPIMADEIQFYTDEEDAEARLGSYLTNPPQIELFRQYLRTQVRPLLFLNENDHPAGFVNVLVDIPEVMPLPHIPSDETGTDILDA